MSSSENGNSEEHVQKKVKLENGTSHDIPKNEVVTTSVTENDHKSNDHEDDDEDNIPITELLKRKSAAISSTSTENTPKTPVSTPRASKTKAKTAMVKVKLEEEENENEKRKKKATTSNDDDDDSDDDIPIAQLLKKKKEEIKKVKEKIQTKTVEVKKEKKEKSSTPSSTPKKTRVSDKKLSTSDASDNFYNTKKGQLVQKFLVRWWYAVTWPEEESIVTIPEGGYEPLEGFPGVFICTSTENLGKIIDNRNADTCPCLRNYSQKSSSELQSLCIQAYTEQIRQLVEAEGEDTPLVRQLRKELKEIKAIDVRAADNDPVVKKSRF